MPKRRRRRSSWRRRLNLYRQVAVLILKCIGWELFGFTAIAVIVFFAAFGDVLPERKQAHVSDESRRWTEVSWQWIRGRWQRARRRLRLQLG